MLGAPVVAGGHVVGAVADLVFDEPLERLVGFEVEALSGRRFFLPRGLASAGADGIAASSPLHFVDDPGYYRSHGIALADLDGELVEVDLESGAVVD
ncbi:MAG TPA: hypothetical protein VE777_19215 [Gaiellales bacterium]|nr:hypothetical protein [Gaiellales bacterium]